MEARAFSLWLDNRNTGAEVFDAAVFSSVEVLSSAALFDEVPFKGEDLSSVVEVLELG